MKKVLAAQGMQRRKGEGEFLPRRHEGTKFLFVPSCLRGKNSFFSAFSAPLRLKLFPFAFARTTAQLPIRLYRLLISPLTGPCCRFQPSCSAYALQAIEKHGVWKGCALAAFRLLRCHPLSRRHGYDPVPETFAFRPVDRL